ncbi:MAG TPA: radical SAM protein [Spirochaetota bacterium]|nr:radical SAM protein [Spirochaetota bacterium]HPI87832.1 radical SAM protein [Spirochaetota bacterium]HPR47436.1 radical SAM protein [Spirochaetota bacterium]
MSYAILLVNPPYPVEETPSPPLGLLYLGTYMKQKGHRVAIDDYVVNSYSPERFRRSIESMKPGIVGVTAVTMNVNKALNILRETKYINPEIITVIGGPHATFDAEALLRDNPFLDYIVRREGELTFNELCRALESGSDLGMIKGLSFRSSGAVVHNEDRPLIENINTLPVPDRSLVSLSKYRAMRLAVNMVTSRGCPHQCIFCVGSRMVGRKVRYFDVSRVVDEFQMLAGLGFRQINIVDDLFTSHKKRCMEICDEIAARGIQHPWSAFARVDTVNEELLASLKRAGCTDLCFGIESGNQVILDLVKKKTNLDMSRKAIEMCKKADIRPLASFILGLPGETPETMKKTMDFAASLGAHYGYHILAPFPGSEVREECEKYKVRITTNDWDRYDANQSICDQDTMRCDEIDRTYNEFNEKFKTKFAQLLREYDEGMEFPHEIIKMITSFKEFHFAMTVVTDDLIGLYPGFPSGTGEKTLEHFSSYLAERTGYSLNDAASYVQHFLASGCIAPVSNSGRDFYRWM